MQIIIDIRRRRLLFAKHERRNHIIPVRDIIAAATAITSSQYSRYRCISVYSPSYQQAETRNPTLMLRFSRSGLGRKSVGPDPNNNYTKNELE